MRLELARVEQLNLGLSAGAVAAAFAFVTPHFATSLAAGAFLEAVNLGAIHRGARKLFQGDSPGARSWIGIFSMRFILLAVAIFMTMEVGAHPAALLIGLSLAMPATLIDAWINRPPVVDPATLPTLLEAESEDDAEYWERYSIWRPGRLLAKTRDDLLSEADPDAGDFTDATDVGDDLDAADDAPDTASAPDAPSAFLSTQAEAASQAAEADDESSR
ncbi:MAG: hypothetical protein ACX98W_10625 [bacterium]